MPDIYLRSGEANPNDVRLRDTTTADSAGQTVLPSAASLTVVGATPAVLAPRAVLPTAATLTISASTPAVLAPRVVLPSAPALTLTRSAPAVLTPRSVAPSAASLTLTRSAPAVTTPRLVLPTLRALTLTASAPTVTVGGGATVLPGPAVLVITGSAPVVTAGGSTAQGSHRVGPRFVIRQASKPVQVVPAPVLAEPEPGTLVLIASQPAVTTPVRTVPLAARLRLVGFAPSVNVNDDALALILAA